MIRFACILRRAGDSDSFDSRLTDALSILRFKWSFANNFKEFLDQSKKGRRTPSLLFVDPRGEGFSNKSFNDHVLNDKVLQAQKIVLLRATPDDDLFSMEDALDVDAMVARTYQPYEISFVLNRLLFPQLENRRRHPRALVSLTIEYKRQGDISLLPARSVDLSVAGTFVHSANPLPVGSIIELKMTIPGVPRAVDCAGTVAHSRIAKADEGQMYPQGMGVRFDQIYTSSRSRLFEYIMPRFLRIERRATNRSLRS